jgi:hypothetical protein
LRASVRALRGAFYWVRESAPFLLFTLQKRRKIMKITMFSVGALILTASQINAQITNGYKTVLITNYIQPNANFRIVNGITYNVVFSKKWGKFQDLEDLGRDIPDMATTGGVMHFVCSDFQISSNVAFFSISNEHFKWNDSYTMQYKTFDEFDHKVAVLNCPKTGIVDFYCIPITNFLCGDGMFLRCYDCGIQATNPIPYVSRSKMKSD